MIRQALGLLLLALVTSSLAWAQATVPRQETLSAAQAREWLARMQAAAASSNFQGTMVHSAGGAVSSSRVTHYASQGQVFEMLEALDGKQHRIARHNDTVHMIWPQNKFVVIEKRETLAAWSTTPQRIDPLASEHYELRRESDSRVAGRDAAVFLLQPRDLLRYAQRFWADRQTALMLRADILASASTVTGTAAQPGSRKAPAASDWQLLESTAFSSLDLSVAARPEQILQAMKPADGYRVARPQQRVVSLEGEGWLLARPVAGFRLAGSVLRGPDPGSTEATVLHALFTDGLTLVSVFVETYDAKVHRAEGFGQQAATSTATLRRGDFWFTVVGDVPPGALKLFATALERRGP